MIHYLFDMINPNNQEKLEQYIAKTKDIISCLSGKKKTKLATYLKSRYSDNWFNDAKELSKATLRN